MHHNQVKACRIPFNTGELYCPVGEAERIEMVCMPRKEVPEFQNALLNRPPRLRQMSAPFTAWRLCHPLDFMGYGVVIVYWYIGAVCSRQVYV